MKFLLISILLITSQLTKGQSVGIIKSNTSPYPGSVLDVESTSKGVLLLV